MLGKNSIDGHRNRDCDSALDFDSNFNVNLDYYRHGLSG